MERIKKFIRSDFFILGPILLFILLRFPSLFEPNWYGDEGIYQIIGHALREGRMLYSEAWDNKPPLLYLIYALADGSQFLTRLFSLIVGVLTVIVFFHLTNRIFTRRSVSAGLTFIFALLFGSPYLEGNIANAENFMLLPILLGLLLAYDVLTKKRIRISYLKNKSLILFIVGILFGTAFTIKVVGVFEFLAVTTLIFFFYEEKIKLKVKWLTCLLLGFIVPISLMGVYFLTSGQLSPFLESFLYSNVSYVGYHNYFLLPQGLLILKVLILLISLITIKFFSKKLSFELIFILVWFCFSIFSSFFSQRSYTHYVLLAMPAILCLGGYIFSQKRINLVALTCYGALLVFLFFHFKPYPAGKTIAYYGNFLSFVFGKNDTGNYQRFFDSDVPRDYAVAEYIKMKQNPGDPLFIWGNSAQIYLLSETLPVGRYTVAYHINNDEAVKETIKALKQKNPRFIIILKDEPQKNLPLTDYAYLLTIDGAAVYEKTN